MYITIVFVNKVDSKVEEGYFLCENITEVPFASSPAFLDAAHILSTPRIVYHHTVITSV